MRYTQLCVFLLKMLFIFELLLVGFVFDFTLNVLIEFIYISGSREVHYIPPVKRST